ncbi:PIRK5 kinase, partial [Mionectes macconnelli]|nr:PIRK5 kinase [Mionectes macconnelli]
EPMASENEEEDEEEEEEDVETDDCSPERDSLLSPLCAISSDSVYSVLSEEGSKPSRMSLFTSSKDSISELTVVSRKSLKSFVSSLKDCMDSGYAEDSDENSLDMLGRTEPKAEKAHHKYRQTLTNKIYKLFKSKSQLVLRRELKDCPGTGSLSLPLRRAESLCASQARLRIPARSRRAHSLPQHVLSQRPPAPPAPQHLSLPCRPFLSYDEDTKVSTLRVVVFGSDRISGKVARAYSNLRARSPPVHVALLMLLAQGLRACRSCPGNPKVTQAVFHHSSFPHDTNQCLSVLASYSRCWKSPQCSASQTKPFLEPVFHTPLVGKVECGATTTVLVLRLRIRCSGAVVSGAAVFHGTFAGWSHIFTLLPWQLTFIGGEKMTEVFIHSLELGHSAATRAIKASGPGSKRLGIDGDREAIPLTLQIAYSKTAVSGRSHWNDVEKVCTSVNLSKACRKYEDLASKTECLNLTMTEVVKRQNSKSKKSFNQQISVSQIKVDKVQIIGVQSSFAVCLDQDEQKILQSVTRCEISVCYKPRDSDPFALRGSSLPAQDPSEFHSLLCLPIATFSGALP